MKIAIIGDYPPMRGGVVKHTQSLAEELIKKGNHVDIFTFREVPNKTNTDGLGIISCLEDTRKYRKYLLNSPALTEILATPYWIKAGKKILRELTPYDVVHLQYEMGLFHPIILKYVAKAKKYGVRTIVSNHEHYGNILDDVNNHYIKRFDKVIVFTQQHKKHLELEGIMGNVEVVHFGTRNTPQNLLGKTPYVGILGMFLPRKGYLEAIDAFRHTLKEVPEAKLLIAGMPAPSKTGRDYHKKMVRKINSCGMKHNVEWLGYVKEEELLNRIKVLLLPYHSITQSSALFDSFAHNIPVLVSNIPGFTEFIEYGKTGWVVDTKDSEKFGKAIAMMLQYPEMIDYMKGNIRKYSMEHSWNNIINDYLRIYNG